MSETSACETPCDACNKKGLPLYVVRYAVAQASAKAPVPGGGFREPSIALPSGTNYTTRLLRSGYLYLFDEVRRRWHGYLVTPNGNFDPFDIEQPDLLPHKAESLVACARDARAQVAGMITVSSAKQAGRIWLGFSDVLWTTDVLRKHVQESWRRRHMRSFDVAAWLGAGAAAHANPIAKLGQEVAEHADASRAKEFSFSPFGFESKRQGKTEEFVKAAEGLMAGKGAIVALDDPAGVAQEISALLAHRLSFFIDGEGGKDKERARKLAVSTAIAQLTAAVANQAELQEISAAQEVAAKLRTDAGLGAMFTNVGDRIDAMERVNAADLDKVKAGAWKKYDAKYDERARAAWQADYDKKRDVFTKAQLEPLGDAHVAWLKSDAMQAQMECNFDPHDARSGGAYAEVMHACVRGTAGVKACFDHYAEALDSGTATQRSNLVMRALVFDQDTLAQAAQAATEFDKRGVPWDNVYGVYKDAVGTMGQGQANGVAKLLHELAGPIAKVMNKMFDGPAKLVAGALSLHAGAPWVKIEVHGSRKEFRRLLVKRVMELNGDLTPQQMKVAVDREIKRLEIRGEIREGRRGAKWITLLDAQHIQGLPKGASYAQSATWLQGAMNTPDKLYEMEMGAKMRQWRGVMNASVRMGMVSGILQLVSLNKLVEDEQKAMAGEKTEAKWRMAAGVMAIGGTVIEISGVALGNLPLAASGLRRGVLQGAVATGFKLFGRLLGAFGGFIMAGWDFYRVVQAGVSGNFELAGLFAASGALGAAVTLGFFFSWNPLLLLVLVAGLVVVGWVLEMQRDNKLQTWLEQCIFGRGSHYASSELEMSEFGLAVK